MTRLDERHVCLVKIGLDLDSGDPVLVCVGCEWTSPAITGSTIVDLTEIRDDHYARSGANDD